MKIHKFEIFKFQLPLKRSIQIRGKTITYREGLILKLTDEKRHSGYGEISPLTGISNEDLRSAISQTLFLKDRLMRKGIPQGLEKCNGGFERWLGKYKLFASVRCGIEMAVLNLISSSKRCSLGQLLTCTSKDSLPLIGLLEGPKAYVCREVRRMLRNGFHTFKLKVGRESVESEIDKVNTVKRLISEHANLRLDINRVWDLRTAIYFGKGVHSRMIEYIEEPVKDDSKIIHFANTIRINVALDETLTTITPSQLKKMQGVNAVVIKPMVIGGLEKSMNFIRKARELDWDVIISSSFESDLGLATLVNFAFGVNTLDEALGLDTAKYFKRHVSTTPCVSDNGFLYRKQIAQVIKNIDFKTLAKIT